jgi:uridine kinase
VPDLDLPAVLARRVRAAPARAGSCRVAAIDGPSGAGKSNLAAALAGHLGAEIVAIDDLIPGWTGLRAGPLIALHDVVEPIARGEEGDYRRYDWVAGEYAERRRVGLAPYLVLEGCGTGSRVLAAYLSLLVWVDADRDLRFERGIARDGEAFRPYWQRWEEESQALFEEEGTAARADVVVDATNGWVVPVTWRVM